MNNWFVTLIQTMLTSISGPLRESIVTSIQEWEVRAKETDDPWDDILVGIAKFLFAIK